MSIIELMIALGIISVVSMGIASLIMNLYKSQNQANILQTLNTLKITFTNLISDGASWSNTVGSAANTNLACLSLTGTCTTFPTPFTSPTIPDPANYPIFTEIRDGSAAGGSIVYANANGTSTNGFTADGRPCNTFDATNGNDACPIQYRFTVRYDCITASPCNQPMVTVFALLTYSPRPNNPMRSVINPNKYNVMVRRGTGIYTRNEVVYITQEEPAGSSAGGGNCGVGVWTNRTFNRSVDPAKNLIPSPIVATSTPTFSAGSYSCDAGAKGFSVKGFTIRILINGVVQPDLWRNAYTSQMPGSQAEAIISKFQITQSANFTIQLQQMCQAAPLTAFPYSESLGFGLGMPVPVGGSYSQPSVHAFISCVRQF